MSGDQELLAQLNQALDQYMTLRMEIPEHIDVYLGLSRSEIEAFSGRQAFSVAATIVQYSMYLQQQENRERAKVSWCESHINAICARHWDDFDQYLPKEIKIMKIANEHETVQKLMELHRQANCRLNEISHLSSIVRYYAGVFNEIGRRRDE